MLEDERPAVEQQQKAVTFCLGPVRRHALHEQHGKGRAGGEVRERIAAGSPVTAAADIVSLCLIRLVSHLEIDED